MSTETASRGIATRVATLGPVGYLPIAPGTWGSGVAVVIWWFGLSDLNHTGYWLLILAVTALALWSSHRAERSLGRDARPIVIDELVGQWTALAACPIKLLPVVLAFFLFRGFDIWKPFPVRSSQRLPGGWGVVADDILAGGYAALVMLIIRWLWLG